MMGLTKIDLENRLGDVRPFFGSRQIYNLGFNLNCLKWPRLHIQQKKAQAQ
jgi:hypothetical protein